MRSAFAFASLGATLLAACTFDGSALDDRACSTSADCDNGTACIDGYCEIAVIDGDSGLGDVDIPDPDIEGDTPGEHDADTLEPVDATDTDTRDADDVDDTGDTPDLTPNDVSDTVDGDAGDAQDDADTTLPDVVDPGCDGAEPFCDGTIAVICLESGEEDRVECDLCVSPLGCTCLDGACVARQCVDDSRRCGEVVPERCVDGRWQPQTACGDDAICVDGSCITFECEPDSVLCEGDTIVRCGADGFVASTDDCQARGAFCDAGECVEWACEPGSVECLDASTLTACNARGTDVEVVGCEPAEFCGEEAGIASCIDDVCVAGELRCDGPFNREQCDAVGSSWLDASSCGGATYCDDGACVDQVCAPSVARCASPTIAAVCDAIGASETVQPCDDDQYCFDGACVEDVCEPLTTRCQDETTLATCNALGSGESSTSCGGSTYCSAGACVADVCEASSTRCAGETTLVACNAAGSAETSTECLASQFCSSGACVSDVCTPETTRCADEATVARCNAFGSGETSSTCADGTVCVDGSCTDRVCETGATTCGDDGNSYVCNASGTAFVPLETCEFGCVEGECLVPSCGDGIVTAAIGESCDDGNPLTCDGCEECEHRGALTFDAGDERLSGASWVPGAAEMTIEAWIETDTAGLVAGVGTFTNDFATLYVDASGVAAFSFNAGGEPITVTGTTSVVGNGYHHLAGVRFREDGAMIFVDGALEGIVYVEKTFGNIDNGALWIGVDPDAFFPAITGVVDEVRFSNAAVYTTRFVPARDISVLDTTIGAYNFNELDGDIAHDLTRANRDLSLSASVGRVDDSCFGGSGPVCGDLIEAPWEECDSMLATCTAGCLLATAACDGVTGPQGACYRYTSIPASWTNAESACTSWGGQLAWSSNAIENRWLAFYVFGGTGSGWIGFNDRGTEGSWRWDGGAPVSYTAWATGEPNNVGNEDCATIEVPAATWVDRGCNNNFRYACRR